MKFGFIVPHNYGLADPQDMVDVAIRAEKLGFDSVWVNHHVLHAGYVLERLGNKPYYDALTVLTYLAAVTEKVRLGTSVLVLPYLNPIVLAKSLATLDVMSGGRLEVGIGVGAMKHESDSLGSDFENRGAYADESIRIMRNLWAEEDPVFKGSFFSYSGVKFSPKPIQKPYPPILVGGQGNPAMRRAARLGDGWHPNGNSPDKMASRIKKLTLIAESEERPLSDLKISVRSELDVLASDSESSENPTVGSKDQILSTIDAYGKLGVQEMVFSVSTDDTERIKTVMENFAEKVMNHSG